MITRRTMIINKNVVSLGCSRFLLGAIQKTRSVKLRLISKVGASYWGKYSIRLLQYLSVGK